MNKELIDSLRYLANRPPYNGAADIMLRAADALEAKAAPVGEACAGIGRCQDQGCPAHYAAEAAPVGERDRERGACVDWFRAPEQAELRRSCAMGWAVYCFQAGAAYQRQSGVANEAEGSAAQKAFWTGFESASLRLFGTDIRAAWNNYKASDEFARLNGAKP